MSSPPKKKLLLAIFGGLIIVSLSAAEPTMNHETALTTYVEKFNTHLWEQIAPHVTKEATTFAGKVSSTVSTPHEIVVARVSCAKSMIVG